MCGSTTQMAQYGAMAHANRARPSHRRLLLGVCQRIVQLSRNTYASLNHHHPCEKLIGDTIMLPFE